MRDGFYRVSIIIGMSEPVVKRLSFLHHRSESKKENVYLFATKNKMFVPRQQGEGDKNKIKKKQIA